MPRPSYPCAEGDVVLTLTGATSLSSSVALRAHFLDLSVDFLSSIECPDLTLCLVGTYTRSVCLSVSPCLAAPTLNVTDLPDLLSEELLSTDNILSDDPVSLWDSIMSWWDTMTRSLYVPLLLLGGLGLAVLALACCLTCCSRR